MNEYVDDTSHLRDVETGSIWFNGDLLREMRRAKRFGDENKDGKMALNIGAWRIECEGYHHDLPYPDGTVESVYFYWLKFYHSGHVIMHIDMDSDGIYGISAWKLGTPWERYAMKGIVKMFGGSHPRLQIEVSVLDKKEDVNEYRQFLLSDC